MIGESPEGDSQVRAPRISGLLSYLRGLDPLKSYLLYAVVILCFFLGLGALRLSTASLPFSSDGTDDARVILNSVRTTRSDDFLRGIPRWLAFQNGGQPDSILDYSNGDEFKEAQTSIVNRVIDAVVLLPDDALQKVLNEVAPVEVKFSIREWFVYLRIFLVIPLFFLSIGYRLRTGFVGAMLVAFTPLSLWFGGSAAAMTAAVLLPITLVVLFVHTYYSQIKWRRAALVVLGSYAGVTVFGAIDYPPWKWPVLFVFATLATGTLLLQYGPKRLLAPFAILLTVGLGIQLSRWLAYSDQYTATLDTVYPGRRRVEGGGGYGNPMSGAVTWLMQTNASKSANTVNPEFAFALNALLWPVALAVPLFCARGASDRRSRSFLMCLVPLGIVILWVVAKWPASLLRFNPLTLVPTERAGQILGIIALLLLVLLSEIRPEMSLTSRAGLAMLAGFLIIEQSIGDSLYWISSYYSHSSSTVAWLSVGALSLCGAAFFILKKPTLALIPVLLFTVFSSYKIQPITVGLGPLVNSPLASEIRDVRQKNADAFWGSDPFWLDALVIAQGVNMISGQQPLGPNKPLWRLFDPNEQFSDNWNRGQSYVHFVWDPNEEGVRIWNPSPDVIQVVASPCNSIFSKLNLKYVLTASLPGPCMKELYASRWMNTPVRIFEVVQES
jgi:hypothetical protein